MPDHRATASDASGDATQRDPEELTFTLEEFFALRQLAAKPKRFWQNYPFMLSVLAFALSLTTSIVSVYTSHQRNILDQQSRLANAVQTLQDLNLKQIEVFEKYKDTPYSGQASGFIANQVNATLLTASDVGLNLGTNASTGQLAAVALGIYGLGDYLRSQKLFELSLAAARSANDESVALRHLGFIKIRHGTSPEARAEGENYFIRAVALDEKYDLAPLPDARAWLKVSALTHWAGTIASFDCARARSLFAKAVGELNVAGRNMDLDQLRVGARGQLATGIGGVVACKPAQDTPPIQ